MIGVRLRKERLVHELRHETVRCIFVVLASFIFDDVALALERRLVHVLKQKSHTIALEPKCEFESVRRHGLVVVRAIGIGGAVDVRRARALERVEEFVFGDVLRPLEHEVLEQVCEPVLSGRLVLRTDVIEHVHAHDRDAMILVEDDFETVRKFRARNGQRRTASGQSSRRRLRLGRRRSRRNRTRKFRGRLYGTVTQFGHPGPRRSPDGLRFGRCRKKQRHAERERCQKGASKQPQPRGAAGVAGTQDRVRRGESFPHAR